MFARIGSIEKRKTNKQNSDSDMKNETSSRSTVAIERLGGFIEKTSRINYVFTVLLSFLLTNSSVSLTSIYLTGYGLNSRNARRHINVGLQILQLLCVVLNWSTGKWVNTLFAGIVSLEFVVYFVTAIVYLKSPSQKSSEFVLFGIFENASQILLFALLLTVEVLALLDPLMFPAKPILLGISAFLLAFPNDNCTRSFILTVLVFLVGIGIHLYRSNL